MRCGLLGDKLGHSYSPQIHAELGDYEYKLYEKQPEEIEDFIKNSDIDGLNVTIPYKQTVIPFLDKISPEVREIGSVNTILKREDGSLYGDNTDIYGFKYLLKSEGIDVKGKKTIVLGSGGTSKTACAALKHLGAGEIVVISRSGEDNYDNIAKHADAQIVINTTPVGMYPNNGKSPVDLSVFDRLEGVADVIYNPAKTALLLQAERMGIPFTGGLPMLVAQAKRASEIWSGEYVYDAVIEEITHSLELQMKNIVLIGMPGCGKSTIARLLSKELGREVIDADKVIVKNAGMTIPEIFESEGEEGFRRRETEALKEICKLSGKIIATGGGCVTRNENYDILKQNGTVVYIKRRLDKLSKKGRPLSQTTSAERMFAIRRPMYERFSDIYIWNEGRISEVIKKLKKKLK